MNLPSYIWDELFEEIASSGLSIIEIAKRYNMNEVTFWKRINKDPELYKKYEATQVMQVEREMAKVVGIADDASPKDVDVAKLRIATRAMVAGKVKPEKWGERIRHEGEIQVTHAIESDRAYKLRLDALGGKGAGPKRVEAPGAVDAITEEVGDNESDTPMVP